MSDWIAVEDQLPAGSFDEVLVFDGHDIYIAFYRHSDSRLLRGWSVSKNGISIDGDACFGDDDTYGPFTHWQPLPAPPGD